MRSRRTVPKIPIAVCALILGVIFFEYQTYRSVYVYRVSPQSDSYSANIRQDGVPAIDHPTFESVSGADQYLNNNGYGIAVQVNQDSRFYPYQILVWHHVVNDVVGGQPLLVTYDPLARSGAVYQRSDQGTMLDFGLSDRMVNSRLLLYDRETHSLWDPLTHTSVDGVKNGSVLSRMPSWIMTWNTYKNGHPNGMVLSRDTGFVRDYTHNPYGNYEFDQSILFSVEQKDTRLSQKERVYGIEWNQTQKAYPVSILQKQNSIHDTINQTSISLEYDEKTDLVRAYQLDASGNHQTEIPLTEAYWFAWVSAFPKTELFK